MAQQPLVDQGLWLSRLHDETHTQHTGYDSSGWVISKSQRPLPDNTQQTQEKTMPPAGFELVIPAGERPQTQALETCSTHY